MATHYAEIIVFKDDDEAWNDANTPNILVNACETQAQNLAIRLLTL